MKKVRLLKMWTERPNQLGVFDMSGNIWEWCQDYFQSDIGLFQKMERLIWKKVMKGFFGEDVIIIGQFTAPFQKVCNCS